METKRDIRRAVTEERAKLDDGLWQQWTRQITASVTGHLLFHSAPDIYCYINTNREAGTKGIIETAWKTGKRVWVPKVTVTADASMEFFQIRDFDELHAGFHGIPEPDGTGKKAVGDGGLVILPGTAFDTRGHRIGYGGGYYDRYLARHPHLRTMAAAFEFQVFDKIPAEAHDIMPEVLITERRILETEAYEKGGQNTMLQLPKDPVLLLSVVNTKIRDYYHTLDALCEDMGIEKDEMIQTLKGIGYEYDESRHQFV